MASTYNRNLMVIEANTFTTDSKFVINGILVDVSADTWAIVLKDRHGNIFYSNSGGTTRPAPYSPAKAFEVDGLVVATFTNITRVIIHVAG
jgi:hypothetical protein